MEGTLNLDRTRRLAEDNIPRLLARFSLPAIVGTMAQALYTTVDAIFVGRAVGPEGLAGIGIAFPCMLVLLAFAMFVGFGAAAQVSIRLGEGRKDEAERVLGNATALLGLASLSLTALGLMFLDPLLRLFGASPAVLPYARAYMGIIVAGTSFQVLGFGLNAVIRGEGNPRTAMLTLLIGVALNTILAPIFVFKFGWGMKGAALATVISQGVSATWVLAYFLGGRSLLRLHAKNLRLDGRLALSILVIGSPHFAMQIAASAMNAILIRRLSLYGGDAAISVMTIIYRIALLIIMPIFGINQGAQPIIGYNYGAERFDRVKKALQTAIMAGTGITVVGFLVSMIFPAQLIRIFGGSDPAFAVVLKEGPRAMRIAQLMLPLIGFQIISASYFQAVGKPRFALLLMLSRQGLLLIPALLILPLFFRLDGVWAAIPTADLCSSVLTAVCLAFELRHLHNRHLDTQAADLACRPAPGYD
jgi:putative MATE family efflux protein